MREINSYIGISNFATYKESKMNFDLKQNLIAFRDPSESFRALEVEKNKKLIYCFLEGPKIKNK